MLKIKKNRKNEKELVVLFIVGILFIAVFLVEKRFFLLKRNNANWSVAHAKIISVERKNICETPEVSSACYDTFISKYSFSVNEKKYISQTTQVFGTNYFSGKILEVYYREDSPEIVFTKEEFFSNKNNNSYLSLIFGLLIIVPIMIFWIYGRIRVRPQH